MVLDQACGGGVLPPEQDPLACRCDGTGLRPLINKVKEGACETATAAAPAVAEAAVF